MTVDTSPLVKTLPLRCSADHAFTTYVERIAEWWPAKDFSVYGQDSVDVVIEPREGGRVFERSSAGETSDWGTVSVWDPKRRLVHSWHPGASADTATEVELRFEPVGGGCELRFEHRGWDTAGEHLSSRPSYDSGWDVVLTPFARLADG